MFRVKEYFASLRTRAVLLCVNAIALGGVSTADAAWNPSNPNPNNFDSALIMQEIAHPHSDLVTIAAHRGIHALAGTNQAPKVAENSHRRAGRRSRSMSS
jgi:hypothetical protein